MLSGTAPDLPAGDVHVLDAPVAEPARVPELSFAAVLAAYAFVFAASAFCAAVLWGRAQLARLREPREASVFPPALQLSRELDVSTEASSKFMAYGRARDGSLWKLELMTIEPTPARAEFDAHWRGWSLQSWRIRPPPRRELELFVFDARVPAKELLRATLPATESAHDVAFAWRPVSGERAAELQFLRIAGARVDVLASARVVGYSAPLVDELFTPGWVPVRGHREQHCGWHPVVGAVSWNGRYAPDVARNQLWPARGRMHFTVSGLDERESEAWITSPARLWPRPLWLVTTEPPDVRELPVSFVAGLPDESAPAELVFTLPIEARAAPNEVEVDDAGHVLARDREREWSIVELALDERARREIEAYWPGWALVAWRVFVPRGRPLDLLLLDARFPSFELLRSELDPSDEPFDIALAWRPETHARAAQVQLVRITRDRARVLASATVRGDSAPELGEPFTPGWRRDGPGPRDGEPWDANVRPVIGALSWCGPGSARRAAEELWPVEGELGNHGEPQDERWQHVRSLRPSRWPWPCWLLATRAPDDLDGAHRDPATRRGVR